MWPIARARAAGVLLALAVLLVPASPLGGSALSGLIGADGPRAAAALASDHGGHPDASGTQPDAGQLALHHDARQAASPLDRRADRGGHFDALLAALPPAALAAALLLGLGAGRDAKHRGGRPAAARSRSRAPPQPLLG
jgi:hypothetical protein